MPLLNYLLPCYTNNCIFCKGTDNGTGSIAEIKAKYRGGKNKTNKEIHFDVDFIVSLIVVQSRVLAFFFFFAENGLCILQEIPSLKLLFKILHKYNES